MASNPIVLNIFTFNSTNDSVEGLPRSLRSVEGYPNVLRRLAVDVEYAPTLHAAWLLRAAKDGQEKIVVLLHERGANFNVIDE